MTASGRAKVLKAFSTELAIMVKLRSPRIVQVFGVVTTDTSYLGLVVEMCAGGALREALEADDYATAVDEAQRRRWLLDQSVVAAWRGNIIASGCFFSGALVEQGTKSTE